METEPKRATILVIDDENFNFDVIEGHLFQDNYELHYAPNAPHAFREIENINPDVILLDVMMPEMDGIECCHRLRQQEKWASIPIIIVTVLDSKEMLTRCFQAGANDYITKPVSRLELRARIESMLKIQQQQIRIQHLCKKLTQANQYLQKENVVLEEEIHQHIEKLEKIAFFDELTGLPNRTFLLKEIHEQLTQSDAEGAEEAEEAETLFTLLYIDCDEFQLINSSLGYAVGDELLLAITERLKQHIASSDILTRVGADEFCALLLGEYSPSELTLMMKAIQSAFRQPFELSSYTLHITASVGVVMENFSYKQAQDVLRDADTAMNNAKKKGKGRLEFFSPQMYSANKERLLLETDLRHALDKREFILYYQPIVHLDGRGTAGFEALVRWIHPQKGMIPPNVFIPCAEETAMIIPIGLQVLEIACAQLSLWNQQGFKDLVMSVNLSTRQFSYPNLIQDIDQVLAETQINPHQLKLEITESALMDNPHVAVKLTEQIIERNIQLSIDDFGTGYSSLGYLTQFPVHTIKLDRSFTVKMEGDARNKAVVQAVVSLGQTLGMSMIAEGIETQSHLNELKQMGCPFGQGYFFAKPMPADQATQWLTTEQGTTPSLTELTSLRQNNISKSQ